ncbi:MAG: c-type cytochrome [Gemmatimonadales bacterium]
MSRLTTALRHPFWQAVALFAGSYLLFKYGLAYLPPLIGMKSAPVPRSVLVQYMLIAAAGILIYLSSDAQRWERFKQPISAALVDPNKRWIRSSFLVVFPLLVAFATYRQAKPKVPLPIQLRSIHPANPSQITVRGKTLTLATLENPLRKSGSLEEHLRTGKRIYYQNCLPCHGDLLDGRGHFAHGFNPTPGSFADPGTIAQLSESFVFWRVAKGGPGLPREGTPWNSAMPVWDEFLTEEEIWSVIIFIYEQSGWKPRALETAGGEKQ